jgi:hypothetical protein
MYFADSWNLTVCAHFQLLLEQTEPWKSSLKFSTKFRTEKNDLDLRKGFSMENLPQARQIWEKKFSRWPDFYDKLH